MFETKKADASSVKISCCGCAIINYCDIFCETNTADREFAPNVTNITAYYQFPFFCQTNDTNDTRLWGCQTRFPQRAAVTIGTQDGAT